MTERNYSTVNPCVMCQPMGSVMAFKGIEDTMVLFHGSQGCSTYMRLHLAHHFREPMDIASTSLSERGAVYGGTENLIKGLNNVISRYEPRVVGVATTCLAETIGDDVERIIKEFRRENSIADGVTIIPVSTPSYEASHTNGYIKAVEAIVRNFTSDPGGDHLTKKIVNFILEESISPADIRELKKMLADTVGSYIFLPDVSETFDSPMKETLPKIATGGTKLSDIANMGNSIITIGMGITNDNKAAEYLKVAHNVPSYDIPIPIGLEYTDRMLSILSEIAEIDIPQEFLEERGRLIDAMIDAHKYVYGVKVAIYGDPDNTLGLLSLVLEMGMHPVLVASGSKSKNFTRMAGKRVEELRPDLETTILEGVDFDTLNDSMKEIDCDMLIGNSNGKYISNELGIPLIRVGFPIHDRLGAQRILTVGYRGAMELVDRITNTLLEVDENRRELKSLEIRGMLQNESGLFMS
ncbi:nitrogenase iron-molybdenum cofactor biosynthesis protein NifN [Methanococcoides sp. FTZ1]|uniref:nitrogenase iron-molybdenum cofactor biosynthesis protein NifN n=1 Tax=Methanococcoides sp. FTZ1 TaxID=3439061 RepID=UPI003F827B73